MSLKIFLIEQKNTALQKHEFIKCKSLIPFVTDIKQKLGTQTVVILDDLMTNLIDNKDNTKQLDAISTQDCHHINSSIIFTCQNLNYGNTKLKQQQQTVSTSLF